MTRHTFVAVALFVILCSSWAIAQISSDNPKHGQVVYEQLCLRCHGQKLDGRGPDAKFLTVPPADLQSLSSRTKNDWELLIIISHGVMFTPMHGFRDVLSEQDIRDVLAYIRMEAPFKPLAEEPEKKLPVS
jgi:mono/diheme cytochrome c family protein